MPLPPDFVASLTCPPTIDIVGMMKSQQTPQNKGVLLELRNEIRPVDLFCYLAARFGAPNGIQNLLRNDDSDNLVHWDWTLLHEEAILYLWGTNFRTDLFVKSELPFGESEKQELISQIRADLKNFGSKMGAMRGKLEHWTEFVNPYWRLSRAISSLRQELDQLDLTSDFTSGYNTPSTAIDNADRWNEISSRYSKAFGLCFGIRSMLPVWAEAFVNLLIYVRARADIKQDVRLLENVFRQQIDIRVKSLHINCSGFERPVDYANPACKKFHTLINERNDLLHGNVSPEKQKFNEVYFLGRVPIFKEYRSLWDRTLAVDSKAVGLDRLKDEVVTVEAFVDYLVSCLEPKVQGVMRAVARKRDLARNHENGRFGILFPDHLIDSRLTFSAAEEDEDGQPCA